MRALLLAGVVAFGWTGAAKADVYNFRYVLPETGNIVTGSLGGRLASDGNTFNIGSFISLAVNGTPVASTPTVYSADSYVFGGSTAPSAKLDKSFLDFALTPGSGTSLIFGVGDALAGVYGHGVSYATPDYGGNGRVQNFVSASFSATEVPEPATLALLGVGLAGIAASRRRHAD